MLEKIRLETAQGELVAFDAILPFTPIAKVILWGSRCFVLHEEKPAVPFYDPREDDLTIYREAFAFAIPTHGFFANQFARRVNS